MRPNGGSPSRRRKARHHRPLAGFPDKKQSPPVVSRSGIVFSPYVHSLLSPLQPIFPLFPVHPFLHAHRPRLSPSAHKGHSSLFCRRSRPLYRSPALSRPSTRCPRPPRVPSPSLLPYCPFLPSLPLLVEGGGDFPWERKTSSRPNGFRLPGLSARPLFAECVGDGRNGRTLANRPAKIHLTRNRRRMVRQSAVASAAEFTPQTAAP